MSEVWEGLPTFANNTLIFWVSSLFEWLSWEIGTLANALSNDKRQIAAYGSIINIVYMIFDISYGFMTVGRTRVNYLIGNGMFTAAKKMGIIVICSEGILGGVFGLLLYVLRYQVAGLYTSHDEGQLEFTVSLLALYSFFVQADMHYNTATMLARSTNHVAFSTLLFAVCSVLVNACLCGLLRTADWTDCRHFFIAMYTCLLAAVLLILAKVLAFDWLLIKPLSSESDSPSVGDSK